MHIIPLLADKLANCRARERGNEGMCQKEEMKVCALLYLIRISKIIHSSVNNSVLI